jgi:hypothetical protein
MRARVKLLSIGSALPAVALFAHGCRTATQVTLDIGTNVVCADMRGVEIVIASDPHEAEHRAALDVAGRRFATATTSACTEGSLPRKIGTLVVTPGSGDGSVVVVAAFGKARPEDCMAPVFAPECIVARRRFGFVDHRSVTLPIVLDPICAGVPCGENSTCVGKKCVDSTVDCESGTCTDPGQRDADGGLVEVDGASPLDGAPLDGETIADASDGSAVDGAKDGASEASVDSGIVGSCPAGPSCVGNRANPSLICAGAGPEQQACCYRPGGLSSCGSFSSCNDAIAGCCRDSTDCEVGSICCASTTMPLPGTRMTCRPRTDCEVAGGAAVCATQGTGGCGTTGTIGCFGGQYSTDPQFFRCS